VAMAGAGGGT